MVDYSKWKNLEFSSDEDDCHPNIEINTWRRLKERMRQEKGIKKREPVLVDKWNTTSVNKDKQKYDISGEKSKSESSSPPPLESSVDQNKDNSNNNEIKQEDENQNKDINNNNNNNNNDNPSIEQKIIQNSESESSKVDNNVTTTTKTQKHKHVKSNENEETTFEARSDPQIFLDENLPKLKKYVKIKNDNKADKYLMENYELVHEAGEGFLITLAVDRAVENGKKEEIELIAKRCLQIHNIVESCKSANLGPQKGVDVFFTRICHPKLKDNYYIEFNKQLQSLLARIESRRIERLKEAQQMEQEEIDDNNHENNAPVGPGGLDPTEVINTLPKEMQEAFVEQNVERLKEVLSKMDAQEASYHMQRCIDSGLWVENAADLK